MVVVLTAAVESGKLAPREALVRTLSTLLRLPTEDSGGADVTDENVLVVLCLLIPQGLFVVHNVRKFWTVLCVVDDDDEVRTEGSISLLLVS